MASKAPNTHLVYVSNCGVERLSAGAAPQELIDATEDYQDNRLLEAVTVSASDDTDAQCVFDIEMDYADGTAELVEDDEFWDVGETILTAGGRGYGSYSEGDDLEYDRDTRLQVIGHPDRSGVVHTLEHSTVGSSCARAPYDTEDTVTVAFRCAPVDVDEQSHTVDFPTLASAELNIMASGDIHVVDAEVEGYHNSGDE